MQPHRPQNERFTVTHKKSEIINFYDYKSNQNEEILILGKMPHKGSDYDSYWANNRDLKCEVTQGEFILSCGL